MNGLKILRAMSKGYQPPRERDACQNCKKGKLVVATEGCIHANRKRIRCSVFKTELSLGGWCPNYERKR